MDAVAPSKSSSACREVDRRLQIAAEYPGWYSYNRMGPMGPMGRMGHMGPRGPIRLIRPIRPITPGYKAHILATENPFAARVPANHPAAESGAGRDDRQK